MKCVKLDQYKGNPVLVFESEADDRYPFSFGTAKASKLLHAMAVNGIVPVIELLMTIADLPDDEAVKIQKELNWAKTPSEFSALRGE